MIKAIQQLHYAMTALRDLEAGYPPREIASPEGNGLQCLVGAIANQLSALGALDANDRQGLVDVFPGIEIQQPGLSSDSASTLLAALVGDGLRFGDCLAAFASEPDDPFAQAARENYQSGSDGDIDLDDRPVLSPSDDGAYVLAWVWVSKEDAGISQEDDADESLSPIPTPFTDKSISDDDLCSDCKHCTYSPGESSSCGKGWPGLVDSSGYVRKCDAFEAAETLDVS